MRWPLDYRSFLNAELSPTTHEKFNENPAVRPYLTAFIMIKGSGTVTLTYPNKLVPGNQAFIYQTIDNVVALPHEGHPYVRVTGNGAVAIDGMRLRNVIFDGIEVQYDGGPLVMENVYFVNCVFKMKSTHSAQLFALAVLEHVPASLTLS